jgi:hypothetical protein
LGNEYERWRQDKGIPKEQSVAYTPEQNGPAERSGGVITVRARAMRIEARLLEDLWPEAMKASVYIINRSPTRTLDGMTP